MNNKLRVIYCAWNRYITDGVDWMKIASDKHILSSMRIKNVHKKIVPSAFQVNEWNENGKTFTTYIPL